MSGAPKVKLNNGYEIPILGLGTYKSFAGKVEQAVKDAIDCGYRHIDTAYLYGNEEEIGRVVREKINDKTVTREEMFITTKLWNTFHEPEKVEYACRLSLKNLGLDYIDLYLVHWPVSFQYIDDATPSPLESEGKILINDKVDLLDTWRAMEELVRKGLVRSIGVSNFNSVQVERIVKDCSIKPVANQVEASPSINQKKLQKFCAERDMVLIAYTPLGRPNFELKTPDYIFDEEVNAIGKKYNKTSAQVVLRFLTQLDIIPVPKSESKERIRQNIDIFDFTLNEVEMNTLEQFNTGTRNSVNHQIFAHSKEYPFNAEF